jgi:DnaJ-class molecular chaperone
MAEIFDLKKCPVCCGEKTILHGKMMKDNRVYDIRVKCPKCKGYGRIGVKRMPQEVCH